MVKRKKVNEGEGNNASSTKYFSWPEHFDKPFADCILECFEKGLIVDGICKNGVYGLLARMMEAKVPGCGVKAKPHVEGRIKKWKKIWHAMTFMRNQSGWGWDEINQCVVCPDERWADFELKHPNCEGLNKKPFMVYDALTPVFCKGRASGDHGVDTNDPICLDGTSGEDEEIPNIADIDANEEILEEINAELAYEKRQPASMPTPTDGAPPKKKKKKGMTVEERLTDATGEMRDLRPLIKQSMDTLARALGESDDLINMRDNLFESLEQLGGLDREEIIAAVTVLSMNDRHLMMFYKIQNVLDKLMFVKRLIG